MLGRQFPREHLVEDHAQRVDVRAAVHRLRFQRLLRRHVSRRPSRRFRRGGRIAVEHLRDAKIRDLHAAILRQQQVLRLDVTMHNPALVRKLQRLAEWWYDRERLLRRQLPGAKQLTQVHAVHVLHQQIEKAVRLAEIMDCDDVRMVQPGERLRLAGEPLRESRLLAPLRREELQGDKAPQGFLPRLVHDPHTAAAEALENLQLRKVRCDLLGRERRRTADHVFRQDSFRAEI
jgi:hypothetical protein